jgi:hypothetical protein
MSKRLSDADRQILRYIYRVFKDEGRWVRSRHLVHDLQALGDAYEIADRIGRELVVIEDPDRKEDAFAKLTVKGLAACEGSDQDLLDFVSALQLFVHKYRATRDGIPQVTEDNFIHDLGLSELQARKMTMLILEEGGLYRSAGYGGAQPARFDLDRRALRFEAVDSIQDYFDIREQERQQRATAQKNNLSRLEKQATTYDYDVALSFAGEDREYVEQVAGILKEHRVRVFYDRFEQIDLWGKDLYVHLDDVYRLEARYCVMFISKHYASKLWTNHERRSAQARAFKDNREYILPVRFDDTDIPGILDTVGYIDARELSPDEIADMVMEKLGRKQPRLFRGMDLGHDLDPMRSSLAKMEPSLFEEICAEILDCFKFQTAHEETLASSVLARSAQIGNGWIRTGAFFNTFTYANQLLTEFGYGVDEDVSRALGRETFFSEGGRVEQLIGACVVVVHSSVVDVPATEDIIQFGNELKSDSIKNVVFFVNDNLYELTYFGAVSTTLWKIELNPAVILADDLAFQVLTTEVYRKYKPRLKWKLRNPL